MPFEDILKIKPAGNKCKTCTFISRLDASTAAEVKVAMDKAIYSHEVIAYGLNQIDTEDNPAPKEGSVRNHRVGLHQ